MREAFHGDLDQITTDLVAIAHLVQSAVERATVAILDADVQVADQVIAEDQEIDERRHALDAHAIDLLARQAPVATDLRTIVTSMRMSADLERMGDLARHVAKLARLRHPEPAVPTELREIVTDMSHVCERIVAKVADCLISQSMELVDEIQLVDDELDELHRRLYAHFADGQWTHGTEAAVDMALLARYYERFGDHAVSVSQKVEYLLTGNWEPYLSRK